MCHGSQDAAEARKNVHVNAHIARLRWWEIREVAAWDQRIFGSEAWSEEFFWSQMATPGVYCAALRTVPPASRAGETTRARKTGQSGVDGVEPHILAGYGVVAVAGHQADIVTIAVVPDYQGWGYGAQLLDHLIDHTRQFSVEAVYLEVAENNTAAQALYTSRGFETLGRRAGYYSGTDALRMRVLV